MSKLTMLRALLFSFSRILLPKPLPLSLNIRTQHHTPSLGSAQTLRLPHHLKCYVMTHLARVRPLWQALARCFVCMAFFTYVGVVWFASAVFFVMYYPSSPLLSSPSSLSEMLLSLLSSLSNCSHRCCQFRQVDLQVRTHTTESTVPLAFHSESVPSRQSRIMGHPHRTATPGTLEHNSELSLPRWHYLKDTLSTRHLSPDSYLN
jgi:hypothetical protein